MNRVNAENSISNSLQKRLSWVETLIFDQSRIDLRYLVEYHYEHWTHTNDLIRISELNVRNVKFDTAFVLFINWEIIPMTLLNRAYIWMFSCVKYEISEHLFRSTKQIISVWRFSRWALVAFETSFTISKLHW